MEYDRPLYFCRVVSSSFFFPHLISAVADWMWWRMQKCRTENRETKLSNQVASFNEYRLFD